MWSRRLSEPIELDDGSVLETLYDARTFLCDIPTDVVPHEKWRRVATMLLNAARTGRADLIAIATTELKRAIGTPHT